jgi:hypothetical protein
MRPPSCSEQTPVYSTGWIVALGGVLALSLTACSLPLCPDGWVRGEGNLCLAVQESLWGDDGVHHGDLLIEDSQGLAQFCDLGHSIEGDLRVVGLEVSSLEALSCLREVSGSLRIESNLKLTVLELPQLTSVGSALLVAGNEKLPAVYFEALERVGKSLSIEYNKALSSAMFPVLEEVVVSVFLYQNAHGPGDADGAEPSGSFPAEKGMVSFPTLWSVGDKFWVRLSNAIRWVEAPLLRDVGDLVKITGNESLESVELSSLDELHSLWISFNGSLSSFALPEAQIIRNSVSILRNAHRPTLRMPSLTSIDNNASISENTALTELDLPSLASIGGNLQIVDNPALLDVEVDQLLEQLGEDNVGGEIDVGDNGGI